MTRPLISDLDRAALRAALATVEAALARGPSFRPASNPDDDVHDLALVLEPAERTRARREDAAAERDGRRKASARRRAAALRVAAEVLRVALRDRASPLDDEIVNVLETALDALPRPRRRSRARPSPLPAGWISAAELARTEGLCPRRVRRLAASGRIGARKIGRSYFIDRASFAALASVRIAARAPISGT